MATSKFQRCIFILTLFEKHPHLTKDQIFDAMEEEFPYENTPSDSSLSRYRQFIASIFPFKIVYNFSTRYYHIENRACTRYKKDLFAYLTSMYQVYDALPLLAELQDRIHYADITAGTNNLCIILHAIKEKRGYTCTYESYKNVTVKERTFIPMFLTTWEGRWYVAAESTTHPDDGPFMYALDRMENIRLTKEKMKPKSKVTIEEYFKDSYGVQHYDPKFEAQDIIIKVTGSQVKYLKSRPIHPSQKIIEEVEGGKDRKGYCIISLRLTPCYNFYQQLLWQREAIEVLQPESVRKALSDIALQIYSIYSPK